jgi:hypothetical protein
MDCQTCNELLITYKSTVKPYTLVMQEMAGLVGADFQLALKELERLRVKCQEANDALTAHWRQDHGESQAASS